MIFSKKVQAILIDWLNNGIEAEAEIMKAALGLEVVLDDMTTIADAAAFRMMAKEFIDCPTNDSGASEEAFYWIAQEAETIMDEIAQNFDVYIHDGSSTEVHHSGDYVTLSELDGKAVAKMESGELYTAVTH